MPIFYDGGELYNYRTQSEFDNGCLWRESQAGPTSDNCDMSSDMREFWGDSIRTSYGVYDNSAASPAMDADVCKTTMDRIFLSNAENLWFYSESQCLITHVVTGSPQAWLDSIATVTKRGKKLIYHGHPGAAQLCLPAYMAANDTALSNRPFDIYSVYCWDGGGGLSVTSRINGNVACSFAAIQGVIAPIKALGAAAASKYWAFLLGGGSSAFDVFDDWTTPISNWGNLGQALVDAGMGGVLFDSEYYSGYQGRILKSANTHAAEHTLAEYQAQTRLRGRQCMDAFKATAPNLPLLSLYGHWISEPDAAASGALNFNAGIPPANDVHGAFLAGMVDSILARSSKGESERIRDAGRVRGRSESLGRGR